jgi:hypothetical protein
MSVKRRDLVKYFEENGFYYCVKAENNLIKYGYNQV